MYSGTEVVSLRRYLSYTTDSYAGAPRKAPTSFRLSPRVLRLQEKLTARTRIGRSACLEMAVREMLDGKEWGKDDHADPVRGVGRAPARR